MDYGSSSVLAAGRGHGYGGGGGGDKLGRLGDAALGNILSFLPATEAARTATLSRRWRHVFAGVHTLSFQESDAPSRMDYRWSPGSRCSYGDVYDVRAPSFVAGVSAALHGRHRGACATTAPLRALRVTFDELGFRGGVDAKIALDSWLSYVAHAAGESLEIDLRMMAERPWRRRVESICERAYALGYGRADDDAEMAERHTGNEEQEPRPCDRMYIVPRSLFSSCVLRALRLDGCRINLPSAIALPSLDTLHLTRVTGRRGTIQLLLSACPSLVCVTLEACGGNLTELSIDGARLRRLALRCCHELASINVGSPELQVFEYRGAIPAFLTMHATPRKVSFCALDFCGVECAVKVFGLMEPFAGVERLHLTSARLGSSFVGDDEAFPCFPMLRNLEITGMLPDYDEDVSAGVLTVARILGQTPRLETLSLFFLPERQPVMENRDDFIEKELVDASRKLKYNPHACLDVPFNVVEIPCCLKETIKEINLVHYQGSVVQRALAKFLLCNAPMVDEVCWKVARGPLSIQRKLMVEIKGWVMNKSAKMMFF